VDLLLIHFPGPRASFWLHGDLPPILRPHRRPASLIVPPPRVLSAAPDGTSLSPPEARKKRRDAWRGLESLYAEGRCRAIGVSNFAVRHLKELQDVATVFPMVNQLELHPRLQQPSLVRWCAAHNVRGPVSQSASGHPPPTHSALPMYMRRARSRV
jgi:diketogulonate reductase-like aldo/keto reductase